MVALTVLSVVACGPLPRPFKTPAEAPPNPLVMEAAALGVWVQPLDGTTLPMSKLLGESVVDGFKRLGIRATTNEAANSRYRLKGAAKLNRDDPSLPYVMVIEWTLSDYDGDVIGIVNEGVPGSREEWDNGSPMVLNAVGGTAPGLVAAMIGEDEKTLEPAGPLLAGLWIAPIEDAPGDGNISLTRAIIIAIKGAGVKLAQERDHAEFVLQGRVSLDAPIDGLERVEIVWTVLTSDGREIGRARQENLVEEGTFSGAWGEVASIVAAAALEGIQGVIQVAGSSRHRLGASPRVLNTDVPLSSGKVILPPPQLELEGLRPRPKSK
ncbi:MAG: hypothetical protein O3A85_12030 [Proteobacteria bacterium]|nr:hypothetical protein [Pseudomonadota bacterium]